VRHDGGAVVSLTRRAVNTTNPHGSPNVGFGERRALCHKTFVSGMGGAYQKRRDTVGEWVIWVPERRNGRSGSWPAGARRARLRADPYEGLGRVAQCQARRNSSISPGPTRHRSDTGTAQRSTGRRHPTLIRGSQRMWAEPDVCGLFLNNVGSCPNGIKLSESHFLLNS
jgi:hypothetical protein